MGTDLSESRRERSEEGRWGDSPLKNSEEYDDEKSKNRGEHKSKDRKRSRREDKDDISRDKDRSKSKDGLKDREKDVKDSGKDRISSKEKRKDRTEEHDKDRAKDKGREKDLDRDKHRGKVHDRDEKDQKRKRESEKERENKPDQDQEKEKDKGKEKEKGREKDKGSDRVEGKDREKEKEKTKERDEERKRDKNKVDHGKDRSRRSRDDHDSRKDGTKDVKLKGDGDFYREKYDFLQGKISPEEEDASLNKQGDEHPSGAKDQSRKDIEERISKVKEERLKRKSEGGSEIQAWVSRSRKLEEKIISEKQKAKQRSMMFDEQDNVDDEEDDNDDDEGFTRSKGATDALAGVKVLHGVDKVLEGGSVVLTLKDQDILAGDDVNENMDILENVEIGEQKRRNEAYKAGKKTTGMYDDKFNDQLDEVKKMLPQYDDPAEEEGVTLDVAGRFTADKKLEELRRKLQIPSQNNQVEDLNSSARISSDYYTPQEMLQFKKPKKKKSLRKKEKLDIDALEAEARAEGLGSSDLRSRNDSKTQIAREEEERAEATRRSNAYQTAVARADEASKALRLEQTLPTLKEEDNADVFDVDAEDLQKSLERARKLALKKQTEKALIGPEAIARLAKSIGSSESLDAQNSTSVDASENKVVFTEMEEFVWGLQHDEGTLSPPSPFFLSSLCTLRLILRSNFYELNNGYFEGEAWAL